MKTENEIKNIFRSADLEEPSEFFESNLMERIALEKPLVKAVKYKPIISIKMIIGVAISMVLIFIISIAFPETNSSAGKFSELFNSIENAVTKNFQNLTILPLIASSAFILLLIDNLFSRRQRKFR